MKILALDTSNQTLAIGIMEDHKILGQLQTTLNKNHSTTLMPALEDLTQKIGIKPSDFDRIVVAQGPGSYTGLRIGVTTAKTDRSAPISAAKSAPTGSLPPSMPMRDCSKSSAARRCGSPRALGRRWRRRSWCCRPSRFPAG